MRVMPYRCEPMPALLPWTALVMVVAIGGCGPPATRIELNTAGGASQASFDVVGLSSRELAALRKLGPGEQAAVFQVFVATDLKDPPSMLGAMAVTGKTLRFTPRFPLEPGVRYRAVLHRAQLSDAPASDDVVADFEISAPPHAPTIITQIYPSAERLPENQLKFYLHFSAPMGRGDAYAHIHLLDADDKEIDRAFLELGEELWDRKLERFTLLFDPGRIKRGLKPREDLGPVLEEGKSYTLLVDREWRDATGTPLTDGARKSFRVSSAETGPIDPAAWKLEVAPAGTNDPLVVRFPKPLDHALLERVVWITDAMGQRVAGSIDVRDGETCWHFTPRKPWTAGEYRLVADAALEDLAGNAIGRAFDVDQFGPIQQKIDTETFAVPFTVTSAR
jgi:hypothetical protein